MTTPAEALRRMADALDANADRPFGGCMVIAAPPMTEGGEIQIIETLILDSGQDWAQFWSLIKAKCDMALREAANAERQGVAFGRRG